MFAIKASTKKHWLLFATFAGPLSLTLVVLSIRLPFIFNPVPLNPDEAELLVGGLQASQSLVPYSTYTTTNFGFLWPSFLGVMQRLGLVTSFAAAHLLSALLLVVTCCAILLSLPAIHRSRFVFLSLPCVIAWSFCGYPSRSVGDFSSLTTEIAPIALLSIGFLFCARGTGLTVSPLIGQFLFGLAPWFKYQALPLSVVLSVVMVARNLRSSGLRFPSRKFQTWVSPSAFAFGLALPLLVLASLGRLTPFFQESILFAARYASGDVPGFSSGIWDKINSTASLFLDQPLVLLTLVFTLSLSLRLKSRSRSLLVTIILIGGGSLTAGFPGNFFRHYSQFTFIAVLMSLALVLRDCESLEKSEPKSRTSAEHFERFLVTSLATLVCLPLVRTVWTEYSQVRWSSLGKTDLVDPNYAPQAFISRACPAGSRVLVWGWSPQEYLIFNWKPAARQVHTVQLQRRLNDLSWALEDIRFAVGHVETKCVLEAIGPNFFGGFDQTHGLREVLPKELSKLLEANFERLSIPEVKEAALWVREP